MRMNSSSRGRQSAKGATVQISSPKDPNAESWLWKEFTYIQELWNKPVASETNVSLRLCIAEIILLVKLSCSGCGSLNSYICSSLRWLASDCRSNHLPHAVPLKEWQDVEPPLLILHLVHKNRFQLSTSVAMAEVNLQSDNFLEMQAGGRALWHTRREAEGAGKGKRAKSYHAFSTVPHATSSPLRRRCCYCCWRCLDAAFIFLHFTLPGLPPPSRLNRAKSTCFWLSTLTMNDGTSTIYLLTLKIIKHWRRENSWPNPTILGISHSNLDSKESNYVF